MAFIDEITLHIEAGRGGDGVVRWLHIKGKEHGGPSGGDGGRGGDVCVVGSRDLGLLAKYRNTKAFSAENGIPGAKDSLHGANGKDLILPLPLGSIVTNLITGLSVSVLSESEPIMILEGGAGGFGNEHFKGSKNQVPMESTPGKEGQKADFHIELQLVADIGLIGFPNAGKSSLLNTLTNATAKVGNYRFTTLEPNLGAFYEFILADIPGLIEGASEGKGLGTKFLRHIARTHMLAHLISCEEADPVSAYEAIRAELTTYGRGLDKKQEIVILTKTDMVDEVTLAKHRSALAKRLKKEDKEIVSITILDDEVMKQFRDMLALRLRVEAKNKEA